ncbi:MAG: PAS domain S-box protein [Deltaproteobacteria bacterium]|nr:PAS domain S-box protein [Deltaproteobacteria bacterium]
MKTTSLQNRILIPLTLGLFSLLVVFLVSLFWIERNNITIRVKHQFESSEHFFYAQQENDARLLIGLLESIMNDRAIQTAMKGKDRQVLLSRTAPLFKRIAAYHPVTHLYFSDAQRINLLRVHQPNRYGDRIDRVTTLRAEKTGKIVYGLELGPLGTLTLRVVAPMIVDGKRIGFVELGEEIDHITAKFKKFLGVELIVHLHKKFLRRSDWEAGMKMLGRASDWDRFPDVVLVEQTLPVNPEALPLFFSEGSHRAETNDVEIVSQNRRFRGRFLVIKDFQGVQVGDMVVLIDVTGQVTRLYYTMGGIALFSVSVGGVLFFLFRFFLGRVEYQLTTAQQKIIDLEKNRTRIESEAKFYSVAQSVNDAMISCDPSGEITFWNQAAVDMFGYQEEEVLGQPLTMLIPERYREAHLKGMERIHSGGQPRIIGKTTELYGVKKEGTEFPLELSLARWTAGNETFYAGFIRDITQRKQAQKALLESEDRYRDLVENSQDLICTHDLDGRLLSVNPRPAKVLGYTRDDLLQMNLRDILIPEMRQKFGEYLEEIKTNRASQGLMFVQTAKGEQRIWEYNNTLRTEGVMEPIVRGMAHDVTEQKRAEKALQRSETLLTQTQKMTKVGGWEYDVEKGKLVWTAEVYRIYGVSPETYDPNDISRNIAFYEDRKTIEKAFKRAVELGEPYELDLMFKNAQGEILWVRTSGQAETKGGKVVRVFGNFWDITERKKAEAALRHTEQRYRTLFEEAPAMYVIMFNKGGIPIIADCNELFLKTLRYPRAEVVNRPLADFYTPASRYHLLEGGGYQRALKNQCLDEERELVTSDGHIVHTLLRALPEVNADGHVYGTRAMFVNITERKQAEAERERLMAAIEQAGENVFITDPEGTIQYVNPAFETVTGYTREEALGRNPRLLKSGQQDEVFYRELWETISAGRTWKGRMINRRKDGKLYTEEATISPVRDEDGRIVNYVAVKRDITEHLRLADQLQQAQKMESVGRLAGGVAHDFNNLLTAIIGNAQIVLLGIGKDETFCDGLNEIVAAGEKAALLTRQLLAFSRKQVFRPEVINLNEVVPDIEKMLRRLIGEDIELETILATDLGQVEVDAMQIEQVIINLAVNARDAMPRGGKLIIETANVELDEEYAANHISVTPGPYVVLSIGDNGIGMTREVQDQIFDPFFTTKEKGKGTGLGLSTVYGIVKQSKGNIWVYSEIGKGTIFKVYLPRVDKEEEKEKGERIKDEVRGGSETVLVVEDEESVRNLIVMVLERFGYRVLTAGNGQEALEIFEGPENSIDLLLTDVIMPRMGGRELAERLEGLQPDLKVLFMSGYTDNAIVHHGILDKGIAFIQKPFRPEDLARKVREVLEG